MSVNRVSMPTERSVPFNDSAKRKTTTFTTVPLDKIYDKERKYDPSVPVTKKAKTLIHSSVPLDPLKEEGTMHLGECLTSAAKADQVAAPLKQRSTSETAPFSSSASSSSSTSPVQSRVSSSQEYHLSKGTRLEYIGQINRFIKDYCCSHEIYRMEEEDQSPAVYAGFIQLPGSVQQMIYKNFVTDFPQFFGMGREGLKHNIAYGMLDVIRGSSYDAIRELQSGKAKKPQSADKL